MSWTDQRDGQDHKPFGVRSMKDEINLEERLRRIDEGVQMLLQQRVVQSSYSTSAAAKLLGRAEFTVREWCRHHRVRATKRPCGRGHSHEWMISREELERVQAEGLLPVIGRQHKSDPEASA
jgi:hypothetical protein